MPARPPAQSFQALSTSLFFPALSSLEKKVKYSEPGRIEQAVLQASASLALFFLFEMSHHLSPLLSMQARPFSCSLYPLVFGASYVHGLALPFGSLAPSGAFHAVGVSAAFSHFSTSQNSHFFAGSFVKHHGLLFLPAGLRQ